jgi:hypothetical protein
MKEKVTGCSLKLHNEDLRYLHSSLNIIKIIKSMHMRWAGNVARMGTKYVQVVGKEIRNN